MKTTKYGIARREQSGNLSLMPLIFEKYQDAEEWKLISGKEDDVVVDVPDFSDTKEVYMAKPAESLRQLIYAKQKLYTKCCYFVESSVLRDKLDTSIRISMLNELHEFLIFAMDKIEKSEKGLRWDGLIYYPGIYGRSVAFSKEDVEHLKKAYVKSCKMINSINEKIASIKKYYIDRNSTFDLNEIVEREFHHYYKVLDNIDYSDIMPPEAKDFAGYLDLE